MIAIAVFIGRDGRSSVHGMPPGCRWVDPPPEPEPTPITLVAGPVTAGEPFAVTPEHWRELGQTFRVFGKEGDR